MTCTHSTDMQSPNKIEINDIVQRLRILIYQSYNHHILHYISLQCVPGLGAQRQKDTPQSGTLDHLPCILLPTHTAYRCLQLVGRSRLVLHQCVVFQSIFSI